MVAGLKNYEIFLYFFLWISANIYSLYKLYDVQSKIFNNNPDAEFRDITEGWPVLDRLKDYSDFEWTTWMYLFSSSWIYYLLHFFVSEFLRKKLKKLVPYWYILASLMYINKLFDAKQSLFIISQPILFGIITFCGASKLFLWVTCVVNLLGINWLKNNSIMWDIFNEFQVDEEEVNLLIICLGWTQLRCLSYCINYIDFWDKKSSLTEDNKRTRFRNIFYDLIKLLSYVLYLPTLYSGPIILYDEFEKSFVCKGNETLEKLASFFKNIIIYLTYTLLLEIAFHYIYFLGMLDGINYIKRMPAMALCGGGLWMGLQFHLKYVISYGAAGAFSRLDNIEPPPTPRCIARIHAYSQMWRYFDVGLYKFLIKYMYVPLIKVISMKTKWSKLPAKQIASFITYVFIFIWHDATYSIFVWAVLNYIGISLEQFGTIIMETDRYKKFKYNVLKSDAMEIRFKALVATPLFAMSAISSFYLFADYEIGNLFFKYSMRPSFWNFIIISLALYSGCHVSMFLKNVSSRTDPAFYSTGKVHFNTDLIKIM